MNMKLYFFYFFYFFLAIWLLGIDDKMFTQTTADLYRMRIRLQSLPRNFSPRDDINPRKSYAKFTPSLPFDPASALKIIFAESRNFNFEHGT